MEIIGRVLKSLITSVLVSLILFVVIFSVVTNEFPPRISRMKAGLENMQKLMQITQEALIARSEQQATKGKNKDGKSDAIDFSNDDKLVESLQKTKKKQRTLGEHIFGFGDDIESAPTVTTAPGAEIKSEILALRVEMAELKTLIKQVKVQLAELRDAIQRR